jgi:hypothetical protein
MVRKKAEKSPRKTVPAKGPSRLHQYSPEKLAIVAKKLRRRAVYLAGIAKKMQDKQIEVIGIDGGDGLTKRGFNEFDRFIGNVKSRMQKVAPDDDLD